MEGYTAPYEFLRHLAVMIVNANFNKNPSSRLRDFLHLPKNCHKCQFLEHDFHKLSKKMKFLIYSDSETELNKSSGSAEIIYWVELH